MTGENGVAQTIIFLSNVLESWHSKLNTFAYNAGKLNEAEWLAFYSQMDEWLEAITKAVTFVGNPTKENNDNTGGLKQGSEIKNM